MRPNKPAHAKLTRDEILEWASRARKAHEELDLRAYDLGGVNLANVELHDVVFGRHERDGAVPARLEEATFRDSSLEHCFFSHAHLIEVDFRGSTLSRCDFRYADFYRTTLEQAKLALCDLYRATIRQGTVMLRTQFELVSLTASLEGSTDLRFDAFDKGDRPGLVTEDESEYRGFLVWTQRDRRVSYSSDDAVANRFADAARTYRNLSAHWAARGQFRDAGRAYVCSRRLERSDIAPGRGDRRCMTRWFGLWFADVLCGFGERLWPIVPWIAIVALLPGVLYTLFGGVAGSHGLLDDLRYSFNQLTDFTPKDLSANNHLVDVVGGIQRVLGIALLGLFGFVLGNRLRSS
jgi:hypothetical protein